MVNGTALKTYLAALPAAQVTAFNIFNNVVKDLGAMSSLSGAVPRSRSSNFSFGTRSSADVPQSGMCSPEFMFNTLFATLGFCAGGSWTASPDFVCAFGTGAMLGCDAAIANAEPDDDGTLPADETIELETAAEDDTTECSEQCTWDDDDSGDEDPSSPDGDGSGCCGECG